MNSVLKEQKLLTLWRLLENAVKEPSPYTLMQLTTVSPATPTGPRTVALCGVDRKAGVLAFTSNFCPQKNREINTNPQVALLALEGEKGMRLRIEGCAEIITDRAICDNSSPHHRMSIANMELIHVNIDKIDWIESDDIPQIRNIYINISGEWVSYCVIP